MSIPTRSPMRVAGAVTNSGNVNTGEQNFTLGGAQTVSFTVGTIDITLSGTFATAFAPAGKCAGSGHDVLIYSGAGRLKDVIFTPAPTGLAPGAGLAGVSGTAAVFYDAGVVISGGPFFASGHKTIGSVAFTATASGNNAVFGPFPGYNAFDVAFNSGLAVDLKPILSGSQITVTFTPETNFGAGSNN